MRLYDFRTEYRENPIGLTEKAPRFSWKIESQEKDTLQTAYEIKVTDEKGNIVWNSGKKASDQSVLISYEGETLADEMLYKVEVSVTNNSPASLHLLPVPVLPPTEPRLEHW